MYQKIFISLIIASFLTIIQYQFEKNDDTEQSSKYLIKSVTVFISSCFISYVCQSLLFDGGLGGGNQQNSRHHRQDVGYDHPPELFNIMEHTQYGEAPF
jgi:hypothetical protein